ncbi:hypothetical protein NDU88_003993, partial [Pleurodeles waltl]
VLSFVKHLQHRRDPADKIEPGEQTKVSEPSCQEQKGYHSVQKAPLLNTLPLDRRRWSAVLSIAPEKERNGRFPLDRRRWSAVLPVAPEKERNG